MTCKVCTISLMFCLFIQNHHLLKDLTEMGVWNEEMKNEIIAANGSVQLSCLSVTFDRILCLFIRIILKLLNSYAWKKGLKTGMYYLRTRPAVDAIKFTVDQISLAKKAEKKTSLTNNADINMKAKALACSVRLSNLCLVCLFWLLFLKIFVSQNFLLLTQLENRDACVMCSG